MKPYADDDGKIDPGYDPSSDSLWEIQDRCRSCIYCHGGSWAAIYHMLYAGSPVIEEIDARQGKVQRLRQGVAYCVCQAGEKLASLHEHERELTAIYKKTPFLIDVLANRHPEWSATPPNDRPATQEEINALHPGLKRAMLRIADWPEPEEREQA